MQTAHTLVEDEVGRQRVAREGGSVEKQHAIAFAREQQRRRRSRAARANHDHVIHTYSVPFWSLSRSKCRSEQAACPRANAVQPAESSAWCAAPDGSARCCTPL